MDFNNLTSERCEQCGGSGVYLVGKGAMLLPTRCGCKTNKNLLNVDREITDDWLANHIPNVWYQHESFDVETLKNAHSDSIKSNPEFIAYSIKLNAIMRAIKLNRTPNHSYFISAPKGFGKKFFAYTLMREFYRKGLNVSPLHPLWRMRDVWVSANRTAEISAMLEGVDVLFFTASKMLENKDLHFLDWVLYECELRGITVIMISRFSREKFIHPNLDIAINYKVERSGAYSEFEYIHLHSTE